tara:strand:- start:183 stop:722 length:540 start_codon:yes stop_codon:yes gene_type:complete
MVDHHLTSTWVDGGCGTFTRQESRYIKLLEEHLVDFGGSVLEIGPGTGDFAKHILNNYNITNYTILDIEKHLPITKKLLKDFKNVDYLASYEYERVFDKSYDLFISIQCLSETPLDYSEKIYQKIDCKNSFILDGKEVCAKYNDMLLDFCKSFKNSVVVPTDMYNSDTQKLYFGSGGRL